jgi:RND family efflux transporter MFP subunit
MYARFKAIRTRILVIAAAATAVTPTPAYLQAQELDLRTVIRVRTAAVEPVPVGADGLATGIVRASRKATVAAEVPGRIVERQAEPGTIAQAGQVLVRIDSQRLNLQFRQAQAMAEARRVDAEHARHEYLRGERLLKKKVVSQDTVDDLRFAERGARAQLQATLVQVATAQRNLQDATVVAPFAGQIEAVHVQVGDYVNPGQPIITQTDFSKARIIVGVTSREAARISAGELAGAGFEELGGSVIGARITSVGRIKDHSNGTYPVELLLEDAQAVEHLREGMIAMVTWQSARSGAPPLSIPSAALVRSDGQIRTYVVEDGRAAIRDVRIGNSDGRRVEVLDGLSAGDVVITEGQFALRDGAQVITAAQITN